MSQALAALLGAFIGATAAIAGGIFSEMYRRHRDCQGIASALAGEIAGIVYMSEKRRYSQFFEHILPQLDLGNDVRIPKLLERGTEYLDPVINRFLDRLGHLPGSLPERIVRLYQYIAGIRIDLHLLAEGEFDAPGKAALIRKT